MAQLDNQATAPPTPVLQDQASKAPAPGAENLAANLDALAANGHTYLDPLAQVALASGGQSVDQTLVIANKIKSSIQSNNAIVDHYFADAQQSRPPSIVQQVTTNLHSLVGHKITTEDHVLTVQQQMQKAGLGKGLPVNRVWTPEWQDALATHNSDKFGKPGIGNVDSKSTVQHVLSFLQPSHIGNFLINTVKALPRETLQMMGDAVYGIASGGSDPKMGQAIAQAFAKPENRTTLDQYVKKASSPTQMLQDVGTLLTFLPMARLATGSAKAVTEMQISGQIAKNSVKKSAISKILGKTQLTALTPLADQAPKYTLLNSIVHSAATGTPSLIQPSARALINKPILGWLYMGLNKILPPILNKAGPAIAKTAPIQMFVRDNLAQRLRLPIVKATNQIGMLAMGAAVKEGVIAGVESKLGGQDGPLDSTVYGLGPISGPLATALDVWGIQMNPGRMNAGAILGHTGATAQALRDTFVDSGALQAWSRANPSLDYGNLVAQHGQEAVDQLISHQLNQIAAQHAADYNLNPLKADPNGWAAMNGPEQEALLVKMKQDIWRNSAPADSDLNKSYQHLIASMNDMETGFRNATLEAAQGTGRIAVGNKVAYAKGITRTGQQIEGNKALGELLSKYPQYIIHPGTFRELKTQLAQHADNVSLAEHDAIHEPIAPDVIPMPDPQILADAKAAFAKADAANNEAKAAFEAIQEQVKAGEASGHMPVGLQSDARRANSAWSHAGVVRGTAGKAVSQAEKDIRVAQKNTAQRGRATTPVIDVPKPDTNAGWMEANNPAAPQGMIGMMRKEGIAAQDNMKLVAKFRAQLADADTPALQDAVRTDVKDSLLGDHGLDIYKMDEHSTDELINVLEDQNSKVAHNIYLAPDAPQEAKDLIAKLDALDYKMVAGQDIGHVFTPGLQRTIEGSYKETKAAKTASFLGLSPNTADSAAVSARTSVETLHEIQARIDSGKIDALPGFNASRLMAFLRDQLPNHVKLTYGQELALGMGKRMGNYDLAIAELTKNNKNIQTTEDAWAWIQAAKKNELGLREIDPRQLKAALMTKIPDSTADLMGLDHGTPFLDKKSADQFVQALWQARLNVPSEMIGGIAKAEDWLYAGFGIGNKSIPGTSGISQIPSRLANIRNRWRFQLSPIFAYRRMFKTAAKMVTEHIPPTLYPEAKMAEMGISKQADALYQRIFPKYNTKNAFLDDAERVVAEGDLANLYSPRDAYRWGAYWLSEQGFSDAEIAQKMENVMNYGARTAAERSLNAIYYPFSFNKTVMRQFGGFLLTHPGQRAVISTLMDQYDKHGGPDMLKWFEDHAPLIKQFEKLNALEHGVGLGQLGGINTPYIQGLYHFFTMLGPKKIDYGKTSENDTTLAILRAYIPALTEFTDLFVNTKGGTKVGGQVGDTFGNAWDQAGAAMEKYIKHTPETDWNVTRHSSMSYSMQQNEAWDYRTRMITMLSKVLDYNYANPNTRKVWPSWIPQETGLWGTPITKTSIGVLVHYKYPQWSNTQAAVIAQQKATEALSFIGQTSVKNPTLGATYKLFDEKARSLSDAVARDSVKPDKLAVFTDAFRGVAIQLAEQDPNFADFYKTHYARLFGPLEAFKP